MRDRPREARTYELLTILSPDVPEEEIPGAIDRIASYVTAAGGTIQTTVRDSPWGRRRLAYPIRHAGRDVRDGFYTLFRLDLVPNRVDDVERELKLNTQVIRYLVTHFSPKALDHRAIEAAEIAAENAAADAYAAAQAEAARVTAEASVAADAGQPDATTDAPASDATAAPDAATTDTPLPAGVAVQPEMAPVGAELPVAGAAADDSGNIDGQDGADTTAAPAAGEER